LAVDEPKGDLAQNDNGLDAPKTDLHVRSYAERHVRSYADTSPCRPGAGGATCRPRWPASPGWLAGDGCATGSRPECGCGCTARGWTGAWPAGADRLGRHSDAGSRQASPAAASSPKSDSAGTAGSSNAPSP